MAFGLKERQDYWPDYYAFLGVGRDADGKEIAAAIRKHYAALHPDANQFATQGVKEVLERIRVHVVKAEEVLTDPALKAKFDAFLAEHPDRVATIKNDGVLVINMMQPLFPEEVDLDALLTGEHRDLVEFSERALQLAGASTGAAKSLTALRIAYKAQPGDPDIKVAYKEALEAALTEATMRLGVAWGDAGMTAKMHGIADAKQPNVHDATAAIEEEIEEAAEKIIPAAVQARTDRLLADKSAPPLLLPGPDGTHTALTTITQDDMDRAVSLARENFKARTHRVKELHKKQAGLLAELLDLSARYEMNPGNGGNEILVHIVNDVTENPPLVMASMKLTLKDGEITSHETIREAKGKTVDEAKTCLPDMRSVGIGITPECFAQVGMEGFVYHALHREGLLKSATPAQGRG